MTLADYLNALTFPDGKKLIWNKNKLTQDQLRLAGEYPYVLMEMGTERPAVRYHQGMMVRRLINLMIYQEPLAPDFLPSTSLMESLYRSLMIAPNYVDEGLYGHDIIKLEYVGGFAPDLNERSSGLSAAVRFNWLYTMSLDPRI